MHIYIENETELMQDFDFEELFTRVVKASADYIKIPYEISVNILLVNDESIHEINLSERKIDKATDVLSFPALDFETPGDFSEVSENDVWLFDPETNDLVLGDIVISLDTANRQAEEYGHSITRELGFLCAHSMLHLCGYDHMEDNEREEMEKMQRKIMDILKIHR